MFHIGMDIRVIPEGTDIIALFPPVIDGVGGAVCAADMNEH